MTPEVNGMDATQTQNIAVYVRVRAQEGRKALTAHAAQGKLTLHTPAPNEDRRFAFDFVGDAATSQADVFDAVGKPLSEACMAGYNATVFAYGQTGAGKTYTMYGPDGGTFLAGDPSVDGEASPACGLTPRVLAQLFALMAREERRCATGLSFRCTGSLLEIYNEQISARVAASLPPSPHPVLSSPPSPPPPPPPPPRPRVRARH